MSTSTVSSWILFDHSHHLVNRYSCIHTIKIVIQKKTNAFINNNGKNLLKIVCAHSQFCSPEEKTPIQVSPAIGEAHIKLISRDWRFFFWKIWSVPSPSISDLSFLRQIIARASKLTFIPPIPSSWDTLSSHQNGLSEVQFWQCFKLYPLFDFH